MPGPITVNRDLPTTTTDILSNSLLDPVPPGVLLIYLASSQRDGVLSVQGPGQTGAISIPPVLRANGIPDLESDMPTVIPTAGGKVLINYTEVTAGDAFSTIIWVPRL